jgi:hypothetical protein
VPLEALKLDSTKLCSADVQHEDSWPLKLLAYKGFKRLEMHSAFDNKFHPRLPASAAPLQLSAAVTHLQLDQVAMGSFGDWVQVLQRLPALEHFALASLRHPQFDPQAPPHFDVSSPCAQAVSHAAGSNICGLLQSACRLQLLLGGFN